MSTLTQTPALEDSVHGASGLKGSGVNGSVVEAPALSPISFAPRPQSEPIKLSATRVKMYQQCPRQYRFRYVDEIPTVITGALAFGQVIHQVLHNLGQWSISSGEPFCEQVAWYEFSRLWDDIVHKENPLFKSDEELLEYGQLAKLMLCGFVEAQRERPLPILLEYPFAIELCDEESGREYTLRGIIDRVDQTEDGLVIVDYKTGKRKPSPRQLREDLQLTIYAFAMRELFGVGVEEIIYYHLRDQTPLTVLRDDSELQLLQKQQLPQVAKGIAEECFAPRPGYYCRFCDYRELCSEEGGVDLRRYEPRSGKE